LSSQDLHILESKETASHVKFALDNSNLSDLERRAIDLRFGLNEQQHPMTFSEVAALTGLSTMGAQKVVVRGLNKLKDDKIMQDLVK
jgi:DNA-directed RNA polymerase sigma subunit (sigma70/sigma32)